MLNTVVRSRYRTQGHALDLKSNMSHPQCKIHWDQSFQGHVFHRVVDKNTLYATAFIRGFRPIISNRSFHGLLKFDHSIDKCVSWAESAVPYDDIALDIDAKEGRIPTYVKLAYFKVEQVQDEVLIEVLMQADPVNVPTYLLLPLMARIIPTQMNNLVKFTQTHGGAPLLYSMDGQLSSIEDFEYQAKEQEMQFKFHRCSSTIQFEFRIDHKKWLLWKENSYQVYFHVIGCSLQLDTYCKQDNWFVKMTISNCQFGSELKFRAYSFGHYQDVQVVILQDQPPPLFAVPATPVPRKTSVVLSTLQSMARWKFQDYEEYLYEMLQNPVVGNIAGTKVYKKPVQGHPVGIVLGVAEYHEDLTAYDLAQVISSAGCRKVWDDLFDDAVTLEKIDDITKTAHSSTIAVWPTAPRDLVIAISNLEMTQDKVVIVAFSLPDQMVPVDLKESKTVRACLNFAVWHLESSNGILKMNYMVQTNPGGSIPKFLLERVSTSFPKCVDSTVQYLRQYGYPPHVLGSELDYQSAKYSHADKQLKVEAPGEYKVKVDMLRWVKNGGLKIEAQSCKFDNGVLTLSGNSIITWQDKSGSFITFNGQPLITSFEQSQESLFVQEDFPVFDVDNTHDIIVAHKAYRQLIDILEFQIWKKQQEQGQVKVYKSQSFVRLSSFTLQDPLRVILDQEMFWNQKLKSSTTKELLPDINFVMKEFKNGKKEQVIQCIKKTVKKELPTVRIAQQSEYFSAWLITRHQHMFKIQYIVEQQVYKEEMVDCMDLLLSYKNTDIKVKNWPAVERDSSWQIALIWFILGLLLMYIVR